MTRRVEFVQEAAEDFITAASFYDEQRPGLARRFVVAVERVLVFTAEQPLSGSPLGGAIRRHAKHRLFCQYRPYVGAATQGNGDGRQKE